MIIGTSNPFVTTTYDTSNLFGVPTNIIKNANGFEEPAASPGLLPELKNVACDKIDAAISDAESLAQVWKPTPELQAAYDKWIVEAKQKQENCKSRTHPMPKTKLSKNLSSVVILMGAVVIGVIAYKLIKK